MHPFDTAVALDSAAENRFAGTVDATYGNMVGPFGGLTNATLLQAVLQHPERRGLPVALTVNFASPLAEGPFEVEALPARTNRSTQHWLVRMLQAGEVAATASVVCAERRSTWSAAEVTAPSGTPAVDAVARLPAVPGFPPWVSRFDMRFVSGAPVLDGREQPDSTAVLWVRDEPPRPLTFASLASICDCFFPRVYQRRRRMSPAGTVSITTYFHADEDLLARQGDRHVLGVARGVNFRNGYFDQRAEIWSDAGELLASSHQLVYYRD